MPASHLAACGLMAGLAALIVSWAAGAEARAAPAGAPAAAEEDAFWHDVTLRLEGALPNTHPQLADEWELYLGRTEGPDGTPRWRSYVLGFSGLFDPGNHGTRASKLYNWVDDEGVLLEATESGRMVRLVVDMTVNEDPWVCGGKARVTIDLVRDGSRLAGSYTGFFDKAKDDRAGPAGRKDTSGKATGAIREDLWPRPVAGHVPLARGEHPRLLFRRQDVPALRKRMETPEGRAILERLKGMLGDGGKMDLWCGYGYGLMYQLTADRAWADLARRYAEGCVAGKVTAPRYGWYTRDGGYMRVGPSVAATAAAYDMCYDAWDDDFRRGLAQKIQDRIFPRLVLCPDLSETDGQLNQRSNHYMNWNGGAGLAILAVRGDPGTDDAVTARSHRVLMQHLKRGLVDGFGDHGWFYEGTFCGRFPTLGGLAPYLQALRVAEGRDFVAGCSEAQWIITKYIYEAVRTGGAVEYHTRGMYKQFKWSHFTGDFAQGFGVLPEDHKSAALWFYAKVAEPGGIRTFDAGGVKQAAYAFVNWPIGLEPRDPARVLGAVLRDEEAGFWVLRSGWQGEGDVVVSMYGDAAVLGMGLKAQAPSGFGPQDKVTYFHHDPAENASVITGAPHGAPGGAAAAVHKSLAVDFSGLSGAPALFAAVHYTPGQAPAAPTAEEAAFAEKLRQSLGGAGSPAPPAAGPAAARTTRVRLAGQEIAVMTIQKGPPPEVRVAGEGPDQKLVVGRRTIAFDGANLVLGRAPSDAKE